MAEGRDDLFLELYRQERNLWDASHPDYFNRAKKKRTLQMISCKMGMTEEGVKKKVNVFRTMYTRHLARTVRIRSGSDPEYMPKWRWFSYLHSFLYPHVTVKKLVNLSTQEADRMIDLYGAPDIQQLLSETNHICNQLSGEDEDSGPADPGSSANQFDSEMSELDTEELPTSSPPAPHPTPSTSQTAALQSSSSPPAMLASLKKSQEPADKLVEMLQDLIRKRAEKRERCGFKRPNENFVSFILDEINKLSEVKQRKARLKIHQIIVEIAEEDE